MKISLLSALISLCLLGSAEVLANPSKYPDGKVVRDSEIIHSHLTITGEERIYRYLVDDLGYFDKYHGTQVDSIYYPYGGTVFKVECVYGTPVSFSYEAVKTPVVLGEPKVRANLSSRGTYDEGGIRTMSSYVKMDRMERAMAAYRFGSRVCFRAETSDRQYTYGWIDGNAQCIISCTGGVNVYKHIYNDEYRFRIKRGFTYDRNSFSSNYIMQNNILVYFRDEQSMMLFFEDIKKYKSASELERAGYVLTRVDRMDVESDSWYPGFTRWGNYAGFTECKLHPKFPSKYFYMPIGTGEDDELHYCGLTYSVVPKGKSFYYLQKHDKNQLSFLTRDQYEKYKTRIVYDEITLRHCVKKADGSFLYVPDDIEADVFKTNPENGTLKQLNLKEFIQAIESAKASNEDFNIGFVHELFEDSCFFREWYYYEGAEKFEKRIAEEISRREKEKAEQAALREKFLKASSAKDFDNVDLIYKKIKKEDRAQVLEKAMLAAIEAKDFDTFSHLSQKGTPTDQVIERLMLATIDVKDFDTFKRMSKKWRTTEQVREKAMLAAIDVKDFDLFDLFSVKWSPPAQVQEKAMLAAIDVKDFNAFDRFSAKWSPTAQVQEKAMLAAIDVKDFDTFDRFSAKWSPTVFALKQMIKTCVNMEMAAEKYVIQLGLLPSYDGSGLRDPADSSADSKDSEMSVLTDMDCYLQGSWCLKTGSYKEAIAFFKRSEYADYQTRIKECREAKRNAPRGHKWVDMGLSVKWATCNVGAHLPEEYGGYYAWGEAETKSNYSWSTYKYGTGDSGPLSKYNTKDSYGRVDNKTQLETGDDVAHVKWGGRWRIPTDAEWTELRTKCTWTWTTQGGVNGYTVTSMLNGNSIFLPAAGAQVNVCPGDVGFHGYYWSSSIAEDYPSRAWGIYFFSSEVGRSYYVSRYDGRSVRPVSE